MKWEYKVESLKDGEHDGDDYQAHLNEMGAREWELVDVFYGAPTRGVYRLILHWKRSRDVGDLADRGTR